MTSRVVVRGAAVVAAVALSVFLVPGASSAAPARLAASGWLTGTLRWPDGSKATFAQVDVYPNGYQANDEVRGYTGASGTYRVQCLAWHCYDVELYLSDPCTAPFDIDHIQLTSRLGRDVTARKGGVLDWRVPQNAIARDAAGGDAESWQTFRAHINQCH